MNAPHPKGALRPARPARAPREGVSPVASDATEPRLRPRGSNQVGMRQFNERVVLQAIRLNGALPKADIARLTQLTPQTVQVIIARLEADRLVRRNAPQRGRVGQPSVPMALNADGAFSIGVKIGRRNLDLLLVDFCAQVRERRTLAYDFPEPDAVFDAIGGLLRELTATLAPKLRPRLHGVGVAAPLSLGGWRTLLGVGPELAQRWVDVDVGDRVRAVTALPVECVKDTSAACVAELVAGRGRSMRSFLYVFVDTFIGGGLVLDSHLHSGVHGNAGAVGSLPLGVAAPTDSPAPAAARAPSAAASTAAAAVQPAAPPAAPAQVLSEASLLQLEARFTAHRLDPAAALDDRALQPPWAVHTRSWLAEAGRVIAMAVNSAACLLDLDGVIVDGSFSRPLLQALLDAVNTAIDRYNWEGVARPQVLAGTIGSDARAVGGALLPLYANFAPDRELFLKLRSA